MTKGVEKLVRLMRLNPTWKLVLNPRDTKTPRWTIDGETVISSIVLRMIADGLVDEVLRNEEGYVHLTLSEKGKTISFAPPARDPKPRPPMPVSSPRWGKAGRLTKAWHRRNDAKIARLRREGISPPEIARRLKVSTEAVYRVLRKRGLVRPYERRLD